MAGLLGKRADHKRLKRHAAVTRATLAYERTGDGARLLRLLEQATPKERRGFMVDTKGCLHGLFGPRGNAGNHDHGVAEAGHPRPHHGSLVFE